MKICREEIFGPVQVIQKFKTIEEVIERANRYFILMFSIVSPCTQCCCCCLSVTFIKTESAEMEFLGISLAKYWSVLLHAIHSPFYRRTFKESILYSGF
jgi:hypothetical protein